MLAFLVVRTSFNFISYLTSSREITPPQLVTHCSCVAAPSSLRPSITLQRSPIRRPRSNVARRGGGSETARQGAGDNGGGELGGDRTHALGAEDICRCVDHYIAVGE